MQQKIVNKRWRIPKGELKVDNPEKLATLDTQNTRRRQEKRKAQHNMCWTPQCAKKHK